jgi:hypothetical protein
MSSGHHVSEYELVASGLPRVDRVISVVAGCLANNDRAHNLVYHHTDTPFICSP